VEYVLQTNSLVEMQAWLSAVQQSMSTEAVSADATETQFATEPLVCGSYGSLIIIYI